MSSKEVGLTCARKVTRELKSTAFSSQLSKMCRYRRRKREHETLSRVPVRVAPSISAFYHSLFSLSSFEQSCFVFKPFKGHLKLRSLNVVNVHTRVRFYILRGVNHMRDAFRLEVGLLRGTPLRVESLACWGESKLLVGTTEGMLYTCEDDPRNDGRLHIVKERGFTRRYPKSTNLKLL